VALTAVIAIGAIVSGLLFDPRSARLWLGVIVLVAIALTFAAWAYGLLKSKTLGRPEDFPSPESRKVFEIDRQRNVLSGQLKVALVVTGALLAFAVVDSVGQSLYLVVMQSSQRTFGYLYSALAALAGAAAFAQRIATWLGGRTNGARLRLPVAALVTSG